MMSKFTLKKVDWHSTSERALGSSPDSDTCVLVDTKQTIVHQPLLAKLQNGKKGPPFRSWQFCTVASSVHSKISLPGFTGQALETS